ncbi:class I SAM-dependent methyltransferase [Desulforhopalus vacuolatus]|uniref:class I SAM-dependent methyltransferase n=1 Tax=Desulforhopalus vacuolatus TaxID=40414 RepID=UPI0019658815|nr:class I SAM-dependent methyltransferase [Desulforhopalus vacuolatus]MBM9520476.1 class I SAM-dependent methyltransferase [Desulforhopalus vacuolatus]
MTDWKKRLYDGYISTGQASNPKQNNDGNPYYERLIAAHLPKDTNVSILDLACGHGDLINSLKKNGYKNVLGVDISAEQVAAAHKLDICEVVHEDLNVFLERSKEKTYDVVFLMDIIEHFEKQEILDLFDKVNQILTDKGTIVIHVPNGAGIFGMRVRYGDFTHQNAFTSKSMQQILHACHFVNVTSFEDKPPIHGLKSFGRRILWPVLTFPLRLLLTAESGTTTHILSQNILVTAKKAAGFK